MKTVLNFLITGTFLFSLPLTAAASSTDSVAASSGQWAFSMTLRRGTQKILLLDNLSEQGFIGSLDVTSFDRPFNEHVTPGTYESIKAYVTRRIHEDLKKPYFSTHIAVCAEHDSLEKPEMNIKGIRYGPLEGDGVMRQFLLNHYEIYVVQAYATFLDELATIMKPSVVMALCRRIVMEVLLSPATSADTTTFPATEKS